MKSINQAAMAGVAALLAAGAGWNLAWTARKPMPIEAGGGYVAALNGSILYAGGTNWQGGVKRWLRDVSRYDKAADRWDMGPALPVALAYGSVVGSGAAMEILGGSDENKLYRESWTLEAGAREWKRSGELPFDPLLGRALEVDGKVYQFGGCPDVADITGCGKQVWVRETGGRWRAAGEMPWGNVSNFAGAVVGERVFLFGGCAMPRAGKLENRADAYSFDVRTGAWRRLRPLESAVRGLSAVTLDGGRVLLVGGYTDAGFSAKVAIYDPATDNYEATTPLPLAVMGMDMVVSGHTVLGFGGENRNRGRTASVFAAPIRKHL